MTNYSVCDGVEKMKLKSTGGMKYVVEPIYRDMYKAVDKLLGEYWPGDYAVANGAISARETREGDKTIITYCLRGKPIFYFAWWIDGYSICWKVAEVAPLDDVSHD